MSYQLEAQFIREAEQRLGVNLPRLYKELLRKQNGGEASIAEDEYELFAIRDASSALRLADTWEDMVSQTLIVRELAECPRKAVAIGRNRLGHYLLLLPDRKAPRLGEHVCKWDPTTGTTHTVARDSREITWL